MKDMETSYYKSVRARLQIQAYIGENRLEPGSAIPSENFFAARLNLSRGTIRKAISGLEERGLLVRRAGSGTYVGDPTRTDADLPVPIHGNVVILLPNDEHYDRIVAAATEVLARRNLKTLHVPVLAVEGELAEFSCLRHQKIDGFILSAVDERFYDQAAKRLTNQPMVFINEGNPTSERLEVGCDDYTGSFNATRYLLTLGHRRILHLGGYKETNTARWRREGYEAAMRQAGLHAYIETEYCNYVGELAYAAMMRRFAGEWKFTAVFADSDTMAYGVYRACREYGVIIPDTLSVVGYANLRPELDSMPALTTVSQNTELIGERAAACLLAQIFREGTPAAATRRIPTQLIIRDSCTYINTKELQ